MINTISEMKKISDNWEDKIGFVPTMGYLHEGHLSLVKAAKMACDKVVVSIYVNPTQFAPNEDLDSYPRDFDKDLSLLEDLDVDFVFFPDSTEIYPEGYKTWVKVDDITSRLCGASRPIHFLGVTTIVTKLINLVNPDLIFMGEKDFQQIAVLKQMLRDLNFRVEIVGCPIVRESDGLAMSSRNKFIEDSDRPKALSLSQSITNAKDMFAIGERSCSNLINQIKKTIKDCGANIDYVEIVDPVNLLPVEFAQADSRIILAAFVGKTRLIDNSSLA